MRRPGSEIVQTRESAFPHAPMKLYRERLCSPPSLPASQPPTGPTSGCRDRVPGSACGVCTCVCLSICKDVCVCVCVREYVCAICVCVCVLLWKCWSYVQLMCFRRSLQLDKKLDTMYVDSTHLVEMPPVVL